MRTYTIHVDVETSSYEGVFFAEHAEDDLRGETGGLVLIPMVAKCGRNHITRMLVSPTVITQTPREAWQQMKCARCKRIVRLKTDLARMTRKT